ncbi:MAG: major capsid protein [Sphingomonas sp.]|nr:major capsid protein [Sphingomonas sp.]
MERTLDIFRNDGFSYTSLQRVVDNAPYVPQALGQMGIFESTPIDTVNALIYEKDGGFAIIPTTERGSPDIQQVRRSGRLFAIETPRISKKDTVRAGELGPGITDMALPENIRARNAAQLVDTRTQQLRTDMEATKELHRLGALQGKVLDADGVRVVFDAFDTFGVAQPATVNINFAADALSVNNAMMYFQENFFVPMRTVLENRWMPNSGIMAMCGDYFWGQLQRNPGFQRQYLLMLQGRQIAAAANPLVANNNWESVYFGGITWWNYRGSTGGAIAVPTNQAILFPVNAKDVFKVYWAPGETLFDSNILGRPEYLYIQQDPYDQMPSYIDIVLRSYPLYACIYPKALMRAQAA